MNDYDKHMYFPLIKNKCFLSCNTKVNSTTCILNLREHYQNLIEEMNNQRNQEIEDRMWMCSHPERKNSFGKGEYMAKSKLFNIYQLTSY